MRFILSAGRIVFFFLQVGALGITYDMFDLQVRHLVYLEGLVDVGRQFVLDILSHIWKSKAYTFAQSFRHERHNFGESVGLILIMVS